MFSRLVLGSVLFSGSLVAALVPTRSISDATITQAPGVELFGRQNDNTYLGWISTNGGWWSRTCASGAVYYTTSSLWRCCNTSVGCKQSDLAIGCTSGSLIFKVPVSSRSASSLSLTTRACTSYMTGSSASSYTMCGTYLMFQNEHDTSPLTQLVCADSNVNWNYYRNAPAAPTALTSTALSSTASSSTAQSSPTPSSPTSTPTAQTTSVVQEKSSSSQVWIAGVIVGPILGIAIGILIAFLLLRRRKNKKNKVSGSIPPPDVFYMPTDQKPSILTYAHEQQNWVAELPAQDTSRFNQTQEIAGHPVHSPIGSPAQYPVSGTSHKYIVETSAPFKSELEGSYPQSQAQAQVETQNPRQ